MNETIRIHRSGTYKYIGAYGSVESFAARIRAAAGKVKELATIMPQGGILEGEANSLEFKALRLERGGLEDWRSVFVTVLLVENAGAKAFFALRGYKL